TLGPGRHPARARPPGDAAHPRAGIAHRRERPRCLAAPVRNAGGQPVAALGISMSARCFELERASLAAVLVDVAERASAVLAGRSLPATSEDPGVLERPRLSRLRSH